MSAPKAPAKNLTSEPPPGTPVVIKHPLGPAPQPPRPTPLHDPAPLWPLVETTPPFKRGKT